MPDERESPSAGWRKVCDEMATDAGVEEATHPCPDCGRTCENVLRDVYECEEHGVFRASASDGDSESSNGEYAEESSNVERTEESSSDSHGVKNRAPGKAD